MIPDRLPAGRPRGSTSFDPVVAAAVGDVIREARVQAGISLEKLALLARVERSHVGKIERGEHALAISALLKISTALGLQGHELLALAEARLPSGYLQRLISPR